MKFSPKVGNGPLNKWLNFGGDPVQCLDTGIVFRIRHYWEIRNVENGHSFVLIRQMTAMVRRALVEVCNTLMLVVYLSSSGKRHKPPMTSPGSDVGGTKLHASKNA